MYANYNNHIGFMRFYFLASVAGSAFHTNFAGVVADASSYDNGISMADFTYEGAACCSLNFKNCTEDGWCGESKEACEQTCPSPSKLIWFEDGPLVIDEANGDLDCLERWKTCNNSALDGTDYLGTDVCCPGLVCYEKNPYYSQCMHPADLNCSDILAAGDVAIIGLNSDNPDEVLLVALEDLPSGLELFLTDNAWMGNSFRNGDFYPDYDGTIKFIVPFGGLPKGTVFGYGRKRSIPFRSHWTSVSGDAFVPSNFGDTLILFCLDSALESETTTSPIRASSPSMIGGPYAYHHHFIYAMHYASGHQWQEGHLTPSEYGPSGSALPPGLEGDGEDDESAPNIYFSVHFDNYQYIGPREYDDKETIQRHLHNISLWDVSDFRFLDWNCTDFRLVPPSSPDNTTEPVMSNTTEPVMSNTTEPVMSNTTESAMSNTTDSVMSNTSAPVMSNTSAPGAYPTAGPGPFPTAGPGTSPTVGPGPFPTVGPGPFPTTTMTTTAAVFPTVGQDVVPTDQPGSYPTPSSTAPLPSPTAGPGVLITSAPVSSSTTSEPGPTPTTAPIPSPTAAPGPTPTEVSPTSGPAPVWTNGPGPGPTSAPGTPPPTLGPGPIPTALPVPSPTVGPATTPTMGPAPTPTTGPGPLPTVTSMTDQPTDDDDHDHDHDHDGGDARHRYLRNHNPK